MMSKTPLRILLFLPYLDVDFGGPVSTTFSLADRLKQAGMQVTILGTAFSNEAVKINSQIISRPTFWPSFAKKNNFYFSYDQVIWFIRHRQQFDIVHLHDFYVFTYIPISWLCRFFSIPYILTPHGSFDFDVSRKKSLVKKIMYLLGFRAVVEHAKKIIAVSKKEQTRIKNLYHHPTKVVFLPNLISPITISRYDIRKELALSADARIILYLGRIHPLKGVIELYRGFKKYILSSGVSDVILVYAGTDAGSEMNLRECIKHDGLSNQVKIIGLVKDERKSALLNESYLLCLPSHSEGFPTVILEAGSSALPVLCTKECNVDDAIESGGAKLIERSASSISQGIRSLIVDEKHRNQMSAQIKKWYTNDYLPEKLIKNYENLYNQLG